MNSSVIDANVWLALMVDNHSHHSASRRWFSTLEPGQAGLCRTVQLTVARLLGNRLVMNQNPLSAAESWSRVTTLLDDERVRFLTEPPELDSVLPGLFRYSEPTSQLINDAYLAAFAISSNRTLVTFDRGFQQFPGLDVDLLDRFSTI